MMNDKELHALTEKYLDGETSIEEEMLLADYFRMHREVPPAMRPVRTMVLGLDALRTDTPEAAPKEQPRPTLSWRVYLRRVAGIAACLLLVASLALTIYRSQNYCEAIVYGQPVSNQELIMKEVSGTMDQIEAQAPVEHQLRDVLMSTD